MTCNEKFEWIFMSIDNFRDTFSCMYLIRASLEVEINCTLCELNKILTIRYYVHIGIFVLEHRVSPPTARLPGPLTIQGEKYLPQ